MRDRLIELLKQKSCAYTECEKECSICENIEMYDSTIESIANYLLANGVVVPPMKLGQTCFEPCDYLNIIDECRVSSITQKADGTFKIRLTNLRGKWVFEITADKIGKTVFLTREEAEQALEQALKEGVWK